MLEMDEPLEETPKVQQVKKEEMVVKPQDNFIPILGLPSDNKYYLNGTRLLARPLNVSEVKLLASMKEENADYIINDVLTRTVKGIDPAEICRGDKYYILFWLRANTYQNSGYLMNFDCEHCGKNGNFKFDTGVFEVVAADDQVEDRKTITLPNSKDGVKVKLLRIRDDNRIREFLKSFERNGVFYDREMLDVAASIVSVNEEKKSIREAYNYIENVLTPPDFAYLLSYIESISFGVSRFVKAKCDYCEEVTPVGVQFRQEFFIPKFDTRGDSSTRD